MPTTGSERALAGYSRRQFLGGLGTGAGAAVLGGGLLGEAAGARGPDAPPSRADRFGRMFELPAFAPATDEVRAALLAIGAPGGAFLDAHDALDAGPIRLIVDESVNGNDPPTNRDNPTHTAGVTFLGQFLDHDMTFDPTSRLGVPTRPEDIRNFRQPQLNLDSLYLDGPFINPELYERRARGANSVKLKLGSGGRFEDLPRDADGSAVIGDPRNDENLIIAGLHAAFILFHNRAIDLVRRAGTSDPAAAFSEARRITTWHYQWVVLHQFLPLIVGQPLVDDVVRAGRSFYRPRGEAFIPVEFQGAAYRFGHSLVRPSYRANLTGERGGPFFALVFDPAAEAANPADPDDLSGGHRAPRRFVGWTTFFRIPGFEADARPNKRIDTRISTPLFNLPLSALPVPGGPLALPQRNLLRHLTWGLPSGQAIADYARLPALATADLDELSVFGLGLERSTPLWYYILKEAQVMQDGLRLGPVGGRIVAEVMIGLLQLDPDSFLTREPGWRPTLPASGGDARGFSMADFLAFAGVAERR
jgi:Animal haem peroxidase